MTRERPLTAEACIALARALLDRKLLSVVQWAAGSAGVLLFSALETDLFQPLIIACSLFLR